MALNGGPHFKFSEAILALETLSTITFAQSGDRTKVTVRWAPHNATPEERRSFDEGHESMRQGWGGTFVQLADYLAAKDAP